MLQRLRNRLSAKAAPAAPQYPGALPAGLRVYAVGDIHGRLDLLRRLETRIAADAACADPGINTVTVYLGDYIDRGPESKMVIDHLLRRPRITADEIFLKGNHEDVLLDFLDDPALAPQWFDFGGMTTLMSYGIADVPRKVAAKRFDVLRDDLAAALPRAHLAFFKNLRLSWEAGDYFFVHAGIDPHRPLDRQDPQTLLWIRDQFTSFYGPLPRRVVHGHSIVSEAESRPNRIAVDTGAYATGLLTCAVIEGTGVRFLDTA